MQLISYPIITFCNVTNHAGPYYEFVIRITCNSFTQRYIKPRKEVRKLHHLKKPLLVISLRCFIIQSSPIVEKSSLASITSRSFDDQILQNSTKLMQQHYFFLVNIEREASFTIVNTSNVMFFMRNVRKQQRQEKLTFVTCDDNVQFVLISFSLFAYIVAYSLLPIPRPTL